MSYCPFRSPAARWFVAFLLPPTCGGQTFSPKPPFWFFQPPLRSDLSGTHETCHTTSSPVPPAGTRCPSDRPLPFQRSPIWSIVGRGEQYCSYTVPHDFGSCG